MVESGTNRWVEEIDRNTQRGLDGSHSHGVDPLSRALARIHATGLLSGLFGGGISLGRVGRAVVTQLVSMRGGGVIWGVCEGGREVLQFAQSAQPGLMVMRSLFFSVNGKWFTERDRGWTRQSKNTRRQHEKLVAKRSQEGEGRSLALSLARMI